MQRAQLPRPEYFVLANGLRVALQPDRRLPLVAAQLCYLGGTRFEPRSLNGLAHLCEHLALRGPDTVPASAYARTIDEAGGVSNGWTFPDCTTFEFMLPSDRLSIGLSVEARRMMHPGSTADGDIDRERRILLQEHQQRTESHPSRQGIEILHSMLYPEDHFYSLPPAGSPAGIRALGAADVEAFFRAVFHSDRAVLAIVGDLDPESASEAIRHHFEEIPSSQAAPADQPVAWSSTGGERRQVSTDRTPAPQAFVAYRVPGLGEPDWYAAMLWASSLAIGRSSPLRLQLEEAGVAQRVKAGMVHMRDASTLCIEATAAPGIDGEQLEHLLLQIIDEIVETGVPELIRLRACRRMVNDHYFQMQRLDRHAALLAMQIAFRGERTDLDSLAEGVEAIGQDSLMAFGQRYCEPGLRATLSVLPEESKG